MLLKTIELKNFRQFVDEKIDFSVDAEKNVTIIIGENGTGKTTFAQAFFWCFYGETSFNDKSVINRTVFEQMPPDVPKDVSVSIKLIHGDVEYTLTRSQTYKKAYSGKPQIDNTKLRISKKGADGNTSYVEPQKVEGEIMKILPKDLAPYFFFDGEKIDNMSKEILNGRKSSNFAEAVSGLTGLKAMSTAIKHLAPGRGTVIGKFNEEYVDASDGKMQELTGQINLLENKIESANKEKSDLEDEISSAEAAKKKFEADIKQYEAGARLQEERDNINSQIRTAKTVKSDSIKDISKAFNRDMTGFLSLSLAKRAMELVSESDYSGKDIPNMHANTIKYLLEKRTCICGTHLDEGSVPCQKVKELLEYLPPHSIGVAVKDFVTNVRSRFCRNITLMEDINKKLDTIITQNDVIDKFEDSLNTIEQKLDGKDAAGEVRAINEQITNCNKVIIRSRRRHDELIGQAARMEEQKSQLENSRSNLSLQNKSNQKIELYKAYTQTIYEELSTEYKEKEAETRERLQGSINDIFKTIYNGGLALSIDEKYNITVFADNYNGQVETSTAQSIAVIFAFISAVSKMAKENKMKEDSDASYSEPYPLVMDAPLSAFDKRRIEAICSAIPETAEQVIIFIKDTDGNLAEQYLGDKILTRHHFEKIDEFNTRLV